MSLLAFDVVLQVTGTVDFTAVVWVALALTVVLCVVVDRLRRSARVGADAPDAVRQGQLIGAGPEA